MANKKLKPYNTRTDLEKITAQWTKISGLHGQAQWSAAVVRAATAAEIAANLAIRAEFAKRSQFDAVFVDGLLRWANGLRGKLEMLLVPLWRGQPGAKEIQKLSQIALGINKKRNDIAHAGQFCSEQDAAELIAKCHDFVVGLVSRYVPGFTLEARLRDEVAE